MLACEVETLARRMARSRWHKNMRSWYAFGTQARWHVVTQARLVRDLANYCVSNYHINTNI